MAKMLPIFALCLALCLGAGTAKAIGEFSESEKPSPQSLGRLRFEFLHSSLVTGFSRLRVHLRRLPISLSIQFVIAMNEHEDEILIHHEEQRAEDFRDIFSASMKKDYPDLYEKNHYEVEAAYAEWREVIVMDNLAFEAISNSTDRDWYEHIVKFERQKTVEILTEIYREVSDRYSSLVSLPPSLFNLAPSRKKQSNSAATNLDFIQEGQRQIQEYKTNLDLLANMLYEAQLDLQRISLRLGAPDIENLNAGQSPEHALSRSCAASL